MVETSEQHAVATVREFFAALEESDFDKALALADPELVWINSSLPTVRGVRRIRRLLDLTARPRVVIGATFHHIAPTGDVVLTERTDTVKLGRVLLGLRHLRVRRRQDRGLAGLLQLGQRAARCRRRCGQGVALRRAVMTRQRS